MSRRYSFTYLDPSKKRGIIKFKDGTYEGHIKDKKPHGFGKLIYDTPDKDCKMYIGEFKNSLFSGTGTMHSKDGYYTGQWDNNQYHGKGRRMNYYGEYIGSFKNGKLHGNGLYYYNGGHIYEGSFKDGKYEGRGKYTHRSGDTCQGLFKNNKLIHGKCKYTFKNGDMFDGCVKRFIAHGKGKWTDAKNYLMYEGNWVNGNLSGKIDIYAIEPKDSSHSILHKQIDYETYIQQQPRFSNHNHYLLPPESIYYGRSESGLKKFIRSSLKRALFMEKESSKDHTLNRRALYRHKPCSFFNIAAHGSYLDKAFDGDNVNTFLIPDGIRLVFFDQSERSLASTIDNLFINDDFMKPNLIQKKSYRRITPALLFSQLKATHIMHDLQNVIENTIFGRTHQILNEFRKQQEYVQPEFTISELFTELGMTSDIDLFLSQGISHINDIKNKSISELQKIGLSYYPARKLYIILQKHVDEQKQRISIYNSKMNCPDLSLSWQPELGKSKYIKLGIYPLPSKELSSDISLQNENGELIEEEIFKGSFMPKIDKSSRVSYYTNSQEQWNTFSRKKSLLSEIVPLLPRGTEEHPCVYFITACRLITPDLGHTKTGLIRQHSDKEHRSFIMRQLSE